MSVPSGPQGRGEDRAVRNWIELIFETVANERELVVVFIYQIPYTNQIPSIRAVGARLLEFSQRVRDHAGGFIRADFSAATPHLRSRTGSRIGHILRSDDLPA